MKLAIIGSRSIEIENIEDYITDEVSEIVSGGARGVDSCAREYAMKRGISLVEFLPDYKRYGKGAPLRRNEEIAKYADGVLAFWDGCSKGTAYTLRCFEKEKKSTTVILIKAAK